MTNNKQNSEFDFIDVLNVVWSGKLVIILTTSVFIGAIYAYEQFKPSPEFKATTVIKSITSIEAEKYSQSNSMEFLQIFKDKTAFQEYSEKKEKEQTEDAQTESVILDEIFAEHLKNSKTFIDVFKKNEVYKPNEFESNEQYELALSKLSTNISLYPPVIKKDQSRAASRDHWLLVFYFDNEEKWLDILKDVKLIANATTQKFIKDRFNNLEIETKARQNFKLEDLDYEIEVLKILIIKKPLTDWNF